VIATVDLNIVIDVFANRIPFISESKPILDYVENRVITGVFASHALTTLYYILRRAAGVKKAEEAVEYVLQHFEIWGAGKEDWQAALEWRFEDFEDAAIAKVAELSGANFIVTRDGADFIQSPVPPITPSALIQLLSPANAAGPQTPP
jgi:predicted nucleic acid-binding protein